MGHVRLESLQLTGFKSFPDSVEMTFPGDVSAIIGPNGCGKSNVVDAILWVLGEQSPSLLRLKQMGDVVFSGAANRPAAGAAEVAIILRSGDGRWEDTDGQLEIRRRVYTSGPSEYRLNGRSARLKDVVDELLSVGLGTRDYSIIEQGRVGQVLSARPTDRRALIEEAAGITRYKVRKHEAELKLEHTRQNLMRLDDVIAEVDRSLRQLKRQARQAERHQRMESDLRDKVETLLVLEVHAVDRRRDDARRRRGQAQNETAAAAAALGGTEADLATARKTLEGGRAELEEARVEVSRLLSSRERLEAFLERSADLLEQLRAKVDRARRERRGLVASRSEIADHVARAGTRLGEQTGEREKVERTVADAAGAAAAAREELSRRDQDSSQLRQDLLRTISSLTDARNRLGDLEREQDRLAYAITQLGHERDRLDARREEIGQRYASAAADSRQAADRAAELDGRRDELVAERGQLSDRAAAAKKEAEDLGQETWELRHRLAGVSGELARHTAAADQLGDALPAGTVEGQVSDVLAPPADLAPVLDRAWHDWLELPVVNLAALDEPTQEQVAELEGRLRLVVAAGSPPAAHHAVPEGAEDLVARAGAAVSAEPWLRRVLPPTWRVESPERARQLADEHPTVVVVGPDGMILRGRVLEPPTAGAAARGTLALREAKRQLEDEIKTTSSRADASGRTHQELAQSLQRTVEALAVLDAERVEAEQDRARTNAVEQSLAQELARLERELASLEEQAARDRALREELGGRHRTLSAEIAAMERRSQELEDRVEQAGAGLEEQKEAVSEALRRLDRWRSEQRLAEEREAAARAEHERLEQELTALDDRVEGLGSEERQSAEELSSTEDEVVRSRTRLAEEQGLLAAARDRERQLSDELKSREHRVAALEQEVRQRRDTHEQAREVLHGIEMELTRIDGEWDRLRDQAATEIEQSPEALLERSPPEDEEVEVLRSAIDDLRARLERLGPVNLLALKEVAELEERSTFLSSQRKDLVSSLKSLDETIREIDATCTERFLETFEQVNSVLGETFSHLFGGGTARLDLVDEDNPLESGIDITAQPPGKRNQSVQLLSGGEKALTALALLISLFRIKPSPFCILDEVDAPLDDANVERLADLVQSMTEHTQFVLITHNRRTMQRADVLYGVTMEEPGVSKVVSVRLEG